jgi:formylglycine-generating enzyme required for sulfatase activity/cytochrome c-type biogenesis protein CcmH/NrfG
LQSRVNALLLIVVFASFGLRGAYSQATNPPAASPAAIQMTNGDGAYALGLKLREEKNYLKGNEAVATAVQSYKKAIELDPALFEAHVRLGLLYRGERNYPLAIDVFKRALTLRPDDAGTINLLGLSYLGLEQYPAALSALDQAIRLKPADAALYFNLGFIYADMGKNDEALKVYNTLLTMDRQRAQALQEKINKSSRLSVNAERPKVIANPKVELEWIPPGSFTRGPAGTQRVTLSKGIYMAKYPVTQGQWQLVMGYNPSFFKDCGADCPVEQVSWNDAQEFIERMNQLNDGYKYRLPSEAEWEYAYRAGTVGAYYADEDIGWNNRNSEGKTHPVGGKTPNAFDLYDMAGHVYEWCLDWYHPTFDGAVTDGSAWLDSDVKKYRIMRGGTFYANGFGDIATNRQKVLPDETSRNNGFRVVADRPNPGLSASETAGLNGYIAEADKAYKAKDYSNAIAAYKKAVALQPSLANAHHILGLIYYEQKQYQRAMVRLQEALRLKPDTAVARHFLGIVYYQLKRYPDAAAALEQDIRLKVNLPESSYWLGRLHFDQKEYEKAVAFFQDAVRLNYDDKADATNRLGVSHFNLKQYPEAVAALQEAVRLKPGEPQMQFNLGFTYVQMGRKGDALQVYATLQTMDKQRAQSLYDAINK